MKTSNNTIGNRSRDLPVRSSVPQPLRHRVPPVSILDTEYDPQPVPSNCQLHDVIHKIHLNVIPLSVSQLYQQTFAAAFLQKSTHALDVTIVNSDVCVSRHTDH
jgi:hypothetical protein